MIRLFQGAEMGAPFPPGRRALVPKPPVPPGGGGSWLPADLFRNRLDFRREHRTFLVLR